jgi:hypothetical protein
MKFVSFPKSQFREIVSRHFMKFHFISSLFVFQFLAICLLASAAIARPNNGYGQQYNSGSSSSGYGGKNIIVPMSQGQTPSLKQVANNNANQGSITWTAPGQVYTAQPVTYVAPQLTFTPPQVNYQGQTVVYTQPAAESSGPQVLNMEGNYNSQQQSSSYGAQQQQSYKQESSSTY